MRGIWYRRYRRGIGGWSDLTQHIEYKALFLIGFLRSIQNSMDIKLLLYWKLLLSCTAYRECHCVKSVHIRSHSGPHFSRIFPHLDWIRSDTEHLSVSLRISPYSVRMRKNAGKMRTRITPNTDSFYAVWLCLKKAVKYYLEVFCEKYAHCRQLY